VQGDAHRVLKRLLVSGPLTGLPTRPSDLALLLELAAQRFEPGRAYPEREVNEVLKRWLDTFCAPFGVDHVTVRRCLVDARLLRRDRAGAKYELARKISPVKVEPAAVMADVQLERARRKRAHLASEKR